MDSKLITILITIITISFGIIGFLTTNLIERLEQGNSIMVDINKNVAVVMERVSNQNYRMDKIERKQDGFDNRLRKMENLRSHKSEK